MAKSPAWQRKAGKNPKGGLNAKGVASYRKENPGSKLKTGVDKAPKTQEELRRQGSFKTRFYCKSPQPPFKKPNGEPTRHALANTAWNGPVVKNAAQAASVCAAGRAQLKRAKKMKEGAKKK